MPVKSINFEYCFEWVIDHYAIRHLTNRYFSIVCIMQNGIEHIMLKQDEIGLLGFIVTRNNVNRHWLVQNKPEPGNINYYQLAPTVQATKSNYERVHGGKITNYLNYFLESNDLILDMLGSEQGDRFLNKFNQNCKVITEHKFRPCNKNYFWINNKELKEKLRENYTINTDARSVISTGSWYLLTENIDEIFLNSPLNNTVSESLNNSYKIKSKNIIKKTERFLTKLNDNFDYPYKYIPLKEMKEHSIVSSGIVDTANNSVISYFDISFQEREVKQWRQPLLISSTMEYCLLVFHIIKDAALFYLKAYPELGFNNRLEFGPPFQTGHGTFKSNKNDIDNLLKDISVICEIEQSDEGGRFYRNSCKYILGQWTGSTATFNTDQGIWLSLGEIEILSQNQGFLTNELRTTLSLLLSFA